MAGALLLALALPSRGEAQRTVCLTPTQDLCVTFSPFVWSAVNTTVDGNPDEYALNGTVSFSGNGNFGGLTPVQFAFRWDQGFAVASPVDVWGYGAIPAFPGSVTLAAGFYSNPFTPAPFLFAEANGTPDNVALTDVDVLGVLFQPGSALVPCGLDPGPITFHDGRYDGPKVLAAGFFPMLFQTNQAGYDDCYENLGVVPEPGTIILVGTGLLGVAGALRRRGSMDLQIEQEA